MAPPKPRARRARGNVSWLPSGAARVPVYGGIDQLTGKRILKMAPLHHHFELKGWAEPKVIVRFWIISVILVLIGLATLKVR